MTQSQPGYGLVRAVNPTTGAEISVSEAYAARKQLKVLDKPASDANGRALRPKPRRQLPPVSASMARADLEAAAVSTGAMTAQEAADAANRGQLVDAIKNAEGDPLDVDTPTTTEPTDGSNSTPEA